MDVEVSREPDSNFAALLSSACDFYLMVQDGCLSASHVHTSAIGRREGQKRPPSSHYPLKKYPPAVVHSLSHISTTPPNCKGAGIGNLYPRLKLGDLARRKDGSVATGRANCRLPGPEVRTHSA